MIKEQIEIVLDLLKVNTVAWGTIGITQSGILHMADLATAVGTALLVLASVIYTTAKLFQLLLRVKWDREDRLNDRQAK
jgi:hypothetical protein